MATAVLFDYRECLKPNPFGSVFDYIQRVDRRRTLQRVDQQTYVLFAGKSAGIKATVVPRAKRLALPRRRAA
jgi:hypothetical protein